MEDVDSKSAAVASNLTRAIEAHAAVIAKGASDGVVVDALNNLRSAAVEYAAYVFDTSGWGDPFAGLEHEDDEDDDPEELEQEDSAETGTVVNVDAHYRLRVKDIGQVATLLPNSIEADDEPLAVDVVTDLFLRDGWDPTGYPEAAIEVLDQEWSCAQG